MAEDRTPRTLDVRAKTTRQWRPASTLPDPTPEPGYRFRWVMSHLMGDAQPTNVSQRFREGYEPVKVADHPELALEGNAKGNVEVGGLILCKIPEEMMQQRAAYYANQTAQQASQASAKFLGQSDPRMPAFSEAKSTSSRGSFGNGS